MRGVARQGSWGRRVAHHARGELRDEGRDKHAEGAGAEVLEPHVVLEVHVAEGQAERHGQGQAQRHVVGAADGVV